MKKSTLLPFTLSLLLFPFESNALEPTGKLGRVSLLTTLNKDSVEYDSYHGQVSIVPTDGISLLESYRWGGVNCPSTIDITPAQLQILADLIGKDRTYIVPKYKNGQPSGIRCLVGFTVIHI